MLCLGFQHNQHRLLCSQWEGQQRMWYEDRMECTFSGTAYPTNMTTRSEHMDRQMWTFRCRWSLHRLIVRFLKVLENYQNVKWMRYPTREEGTY